MMRERERRGAKQNQDAELRDRELHPGHPHRKKRDPWQGKRERKGGEAKITDDEREGEEGGEAKPRR